MHAQIVSFAAFILAATSAFSSPLPNYTGASSSVSARPVDEEQDLPLAQFSERRQAQLIPLAVKYGPTVVEHAPQIIAATEKYGPKVVHGVEKYAPKVEHKLESGAKKVWHKFIH